LIFYTGWCNHRKNKKENQKSPKEAVMKLEKFGWDEYFKTRFQALAAAEAFPVRVFTVDRDLYHVYSKKKRLVA
jgi:hypothetical protein